MSEKVYGYLGLGWRTDNILQGGAIPPRGVVAALKAIGADGVVCLDMRPDDELAAVADDVRAAGMDFVLGFRWPRGGRARGPDDVDFDRLARARAITPRLALGNVASQEWFGNTQHSDRAGRREARVYLKLARKHKFEWVCSITHRTICHDIFDKAKLKPMLRDTMCICFCGYILTGYCYGDVRMMHQRSTSLGKRRLHGIYGLNADRLKSWLAGMDCLTGAGFQRSITGGSRVYAKDVGFSGIMTGMPVDLTGSLDVDILPAMQTPPERCGIWEDYQNNELIRGGELEWMPGGDRAG